MAIRISENLRVLRLNERYSMEDIAEIIGVSRQAVAKWESGETLPDIEKCVKLAKLYKVSLDALVSETLCAAGESDDGKYFFGVSKLTNGMITIPQQACEIFNLSEGDGVLLLGDEKRGMALVKCDGVY